ERVDRGVNQAAGAVPVGNVVGVRERVAPGGDALVAELLRGRVVGTDTLARDAEVVHDDTRTLTRERQRVLAADAARGARDDDDPPFTDARHAPPSTRTPGHLPYRRARSDPGGDGWSEWLVSPR